MGWGVYPEGMRKMLNYIQKEFNPRGGIIITGGLLLLLLVLLAAAAGVC
jgi:beta-glucosidase/6-phospho-beta-glucosidase/beta-galactosidase